MVLYNASCAGASNERKILKYSASIISNVTNGMIIPNTIPMFPGRTVLNSGQWIII